MTDEEWRLTRKFLREVRRHWPGARIVLRPEPGEPWVTREPEQAARAERHAMQLAAHKRAIKRQARAYRDQGVVPGGGVSFTQSEIRAGLHPRLRHLLQTDKG